MKDGFIIYKSLYEPISELTTHDKGLLLEALFLYQRSGETKEDLPPLVLMAFKFFKNQFDIDQKKYEAKCSKNQESANIRWNANASERKQTNTNDADKDKGKEKDKGKDKELLLKQFLSWGVENNLDTDKVENNFLNAWDYYEGNGWKDRNNKPITDIQGSIRKVWFKDLHKFKKELKIAKIVLQAAMSVPAQMTALCTKYNVTEEYLRDLYLKQ